MHATCSFMAPTHFQSGSTKRTLSLDKHRPSPPPGLPKVPVLRAMRLVEHESPPTPQPQDENSGAARLPPVKTGLMRPFPAIASDAQRVHTWRMAYHHTQHPVFASSQLRRSPSCISPRTKLGCAALARIDRQHQGRVLKEKLVVLEILAGTLQRYLTIYMSQESLSFVLV